MATGGSLASPLDPCEPASGPPMDLEATLAQLASALSDERASEVSRLRDRWRDRTFTVLIVGEFNRGKSTVLNALIGRDLLPTGILPVTAVPTRVRSGPRGRALARFRDGTEREVLLTEIRDYVDESRNPGNVRGVAILDVEIEAGVPSGVVLVDVPGFGSIHKHNTESALAALPEADAALVVASVDPPLGDAELGLVRSLARNAAQVAIVLNKTDSLDADERRAVEDFTRRALDREGLSAAGVWPVSAREGLRARRSHDDLGWRRSGMQALAASLARLFSQEREPLLARSLCGKAGRLLDQELALVDLQLAAAERSARQLGEIVEAFRLRRTTAERDRGEAVAIFRRRFDALFAGYAERAAEAWKGPRARCASRLEQIVAQEGGLSRHEAWKAMETAAREAAEAFADTFIFEEADRLARAYRELSTEIGQATAERVHEVWRQAAELLLFEPPAPEPPPAAPAPRPAVVAEGSQHLLLDDLHDAAAHLLPRGAALRRLARKALEEGEVLYGRTVERSREAFSRAFDGHFVGLVAAFDESAKQVARTVEAVLSAAEERASALDEGTASAAPLDVARRAALLELRETLRRTSLGVRPQ